MATSFEYAVTEDGTLIRQRLAPNGIDVVPFPEAFNHSTGEWKLPRVMCGELMEALGICKAEALALATDYSRAKGWKIVHDYYTTCWDDKARRRIPCVSMNYERTNTAHS